MWSDRNVDCSNWGIMAPFGGGVTSTGAQGLISALMVRYLWHSHRWVYHHFHPSHVHCRFCPCLRQAHLQSITMKSLTGMREKQIGRSTWRTVYLFAVSIFFKLVIRGGSLLFFLLMNIPWFSLKQRHVSFTPPPPTLLNCSHLNCPHLSDRE